MIEATFAYLDPGTSATILQLVLAGTVGIGALVKLRWQSIKRVFREDDEPLGDSEKSVKTTE